MSYSFDFAVATKAEAKERVATELAAVVSVQPVHARDRDAALAAANTFIDMLSDDDTKDIRVNVHGSVSYPWSADMDVEAVPLSQASVGVSAWHVPKAGSVPA
ncbi:hypothetical protein [Paraburkholderia terricola]|uniref:hypothetical protein n=1 Tax=Paraburkholderia terricola TaxID=169427 RepID=UPI003ECE8280